MQHPGRLLATGRDADIFEFGDGRVLRRSRNARSMVTEAQTMEFVRSRGYPTPEVFDVSNDGSEMVMERIYGPTMLEAASARPWQIRSFGNILAELHRTLHLLAAPSWLADAPFGSGDRLIHLDLHPLNVLMSSSGPVVIDWTNAARGNPLSDVALTWALLASGEVPSSRIQSVVLGVGRQLLLRAFLKSFQSDELRSTLREAVEWKCSDPNMNELEISRMRLLLR